jgi:vitamin-K-epoxide reductase (warfarin-sensitive)
MIITALLAAAGWLLSLYALFIEKKLKLNPNYKPICDISDNASCTKPILSEYGKIFGVSNAFLGTAFYLLLFFVAWRGFAHAAFWLSVMACLGSIIFAYILYVKVRSFCLICNAIYLINIGLLVSSYWYCKGW